MKAMILAAGKGTRLGDITLSKPKILLDIGGITLLEWIVRKLNHHGFDEIIINVHHLADKVILAGREIGKRVGVDISFSEETHELLDTGGGLYKAKDFFDDKPFLLYNGDIVTDLNLGELYMLNTITKAIATLAIRNRPGNRFFLIDEKGLLCGWVNRETGEKIVIDNGHGKLEDIAFSAISVINPVIFNYMEEGRYSLRPVYLEIAKNNIVNSLKHNEGTWIDIGSLPKLDECRKLFIDREDPTLLY